MHPLTRRALWVCVLVVHPRASSKQEMGCRWEVKKRPNFGFDKIYGAQLAQKCLFVCGVCCVNTCMRVSIITRRVRLRR